MATTKVNSEFIAVNAISGTIIADGAITSTHLAANCVDSSELVTGSIDTIHIAANQVTATKIVTNGVLTRHISDDQVTGDKIASATIVSGNIANNAILTQHIDDNQINIDQLNVSDGSSGQVLQTNGSGTLSFATVSGTTINNNADNRVITGSGTANTLNGEANLTFGSSLVITKSEGAANSLNDQISLEHTSGSTGYHIKTIRAAANDNPDGIAFVENTTERMRIRGGSVGIGTDSPTNYYSDRLVVSAGNEDGLTIAANATTDTNYLMFADGTSGDARYRGYMGYNHSNDELIQTSYGFQSFYTGSSPAERMRIDSSGRVGIGTNSPGNGYGGAITAAKVAILSGAAGNNGGSSTLLIGGDDKHYAYMQGTHTSSGNTQLDFGTANGANNPTQRATLNEHGAWKVKSTSGAYFNIISKYHEINSNDGALTTVLIRNGSTYYANCANFWLYGGAPNNTQSQFWTCNDTVGQKASLQSNGGFYNYQSNNSNLCDEREKKNIEVLPSTWNSVKSWKLKKFHYNEDENSDDKRLGVIAQEIETTNPELITAHTRVQAKDAVLWTKEDDLPEGVSIGDTKTAAQDAVVRKGVKEQQMYIMAIKALQEAMTEIESLKARIETLEG